MSQTVSPEQDQETQSLPEQMYSHLSDYYFNRIPFLEMLDQWETLLGLPRFSQQRYTSQHTLTQMHGPTPGYSAHQPLEPIDETGKR